MPGWIEILIRSAGLFFLALFVVRLMGKRQTSRLTYFDLITGVAIGVIAAGVSLKLVDNLAHGLLSLGVWTLLPIIIQVLSLKFKAVRDIVQGKETLLINHGKVLEDKLMEARLTPEDLLSYLRRKNVFNFADVEFAVLEPDGEVSVLLKRDNQPVTAKTLRMNAGYESAPQTVILDGNIMDEPLTAMGLNRNWLHTELEKAGVASENVFLAQVDSAGQLYLDLFDDTVQNPKPKTKQFVYAALKKCQADSELYAISTKEEQAGQMYLQNAELLSNVVSELEPLLKS